MNQIDFQFLNFSHPSDAKASRARRAVRSHVTRQQHQREHALQAARRAQSYQGPSSQAEPATPWEHARTFPSVRPPTLEIPGGSTDVAQSTSSPEASSASPSPSNSPTYELHRRVDLAELYPQDWHPFIPRILVCGIEYSGTGILEYTLTRSRSTIEQTWRSTSRTSMVR